MPHDSIIISTSTQPSQWLSIHIDYANIAATRLIRRRLLLVQCFNHCCITGAADNKSGFMHMRNKHMQFINSLRNLILLPTPQPDSTHGLCDVFDYACYAINANASAALVNAIA